MKIREGFLLRNVAGNMWLFQSVRQYWDFNGMMSLNETGAFIFSKMLDGTTKEQLIEDLISEYEVEREIAQKDVDDFIKKVEGEGLLE